MVRSRATRAMSRKRLLAFARMTSARASMSCVVKCWMISSLPSWLILEPNSRMARLVMDDDAWWTVAFICGRGQRVYGSESRRRLGLHYGSAVDDQGAKTGG